MLQWPFGQGMSRQPPAALTYATTRGCKVVVQKECLIPPLVSGCCLLEGTDHSENLKEILGASDNFELRIAQKLYPMYGKLLGLHLPAF